MDSLAPPKAVLPDVQPPAEAPPVPKDGPAAKAADERLDERLAALRKAIIPDKLLVRLDPDAGRFVQTLTDANTDETVLRYPNDTQLAYSRAVMAYMKAFAPK